MTTRESRRNPYNLLVAFNSAQISKGDLYIDDGESLNSVTSKKYTLIQYEATSGRLSSRHIHQDYDVSALFIDTIRVLGAQNVCRVYVDGVETRTFRYDPQTQIFELYDQRIHLQSNHLITWNCE